MSEAHPVTAKMTARSARLRLAVVLAYLLAAGTVLERTHGQPLTGPPSLLPFGLLLVPLLVLLWPYLRPDREPAPFAGPGEPLRKRILASIHLWQPLEHGSGYQILLLLAAGLLIYYVLYRIPILDGLPEARYGLVFGCWLLAILLFAGAVLAPRLSQLRTGLTSLWTRFRSAERWLVAAGAGIMLAAAVVRLWRIDTIPYVLAGDEGAQGLEAIKVLNGTMRNPFSTGWLGVPTMSFFFNSFSISWFGRTIAALRLPWALVGTTTIGLAFLLGRQLKGTRYGLLTAALLAVYHYHIHFSRLGSNQVADPFFGVLALLFLQRALDKGRRVDWLLTGAVAGLAFYFYAGARFTPVVVVAVLGYYVLFERAAFLRQHGQGIFVACATFFLVAAPMLQYSLRFPDEFNARLNQVGILQSGWLEREVAITGQSTAALLFDQFRRSVLAFNYYPDRTVWYGLREPLLDPWFGALFLLGLGFVSLRTFLGRPRDSRFAPIVAWWWGGILLGGMMTESPPSSQRLVTLTVPTCFILAVIIWELIDLVQASLGSRSQRRRLSPWLASAVAVLFGISSLHLYFVEYTPQRIYGGPQAKIAMAVAPALAEYDPGHQHYFVGAPRMYWGFATLPYLLPGRTGSDILEPLQSPPPRDESELARGLIYIFLPERESELVQVVATYPEGETRYLSDETGKHLALLYVVPPR